MHTHDARRNVWSDETRSLFDTPTVRLKEKKKILEKKKTVMSILYLDFAPDHEKAFRVLHEVLGLLVGESLI